VIISRTPLRISFVGGGSDIDWFYKKTPGAVVTTAIDKYIYITVNKKFDDKIRASYSKTEIVDSVRRIKHELIREGLSLLGIDGGIEITSISDIPSEGTGLGSSSSYTVGLLNALYANLGKHVSAEKLAREACSIEIARLKKPIGKQDQYISAFGGFEYLQFNKDGSVFVDPVIMKKRKLQELQQSLLLFYTGITRTSDKILREQKKEIKRNGYKRENMNKMVAFAKQARRALNRNRLDDFGEILHHNWLLKKSLSDAISNEKIEAWYAKARMKGAIGGKICGAGGGGFLLLYASIEKQLAIRQALHELRFVPFTFEPQGSKIIYVS